MTNSNFFVGEGGAEDFIEICSDDSDDSVTVADCAFLTDHKKDLPVYLTSLQEVAFFSFLCFNPTFQLYEDSNIPVYTEATDTEIETLKEVAIQQRNARKAIKIAKETCEQKKLDTENEATKNVASTKPPPPRCKKAPSKPPQNKRKSKLPQYKSPAKVSPKSTTTTRSGRIVRRVAK